MGGLIGWLVESFTSRLVYRLIGVQINMVVKEILHLVLQIMLVIIFKLMPDGHLDIILWQNTEKIHRAECAQREVTKSRQKKERRRC